MFTEHKISWPKHWTNGGTGMTKFEASKIPLFKRAIAEYKEPGVWIEYGGDMPSLHSSKQDLSEFWSIYYRIEKESSAQPENAA